MTTYASTLKTSELVHELKNRGWIKTAEIKAGESIVVYDPKTDESFDLEGPATVLGVPEEVMRDW